MDIKYLLSTILILSTVNVVRCQNEDQFSMPEEKDNQFQSDVPPENDTLEGSGVGAIESPGDTPDSTTPLALAEPDNGLIAPMSGIAAFSVVSDTVLCPTECTCSQEGDGDEYKLTVDCSSKDLIEMPAPVDTRATVLNLQNNKLTELPKSISELTNMKVLNLKNNSLKNLTYGTVSELSELRTLNLANNKLLEVPQELKNGFGLTKLEELDIGGNDIRDMLQTEIFSHFTSIKKLTLPAVSDIYVEQLCRSLSKLQTICTESCNEKVIDCPDFVEHFDDLIPVIPGEIPADINTVNSDPSINHGADGSAPEVPVRTGDAKEDLTTENIIRAAVEKETPTDTPQVFRAAMMNSPVEATVLKEPTDDTKQDMRVGEVNSTENPNPDGGGVDKSVVGIIIAVMIVVVAALVIKKNWTSIRNKFSSSPRPASERPQAQINGTTPEEVPLQEKSPV